MSSVKQAQKEARAMLAQMQVATIIPSLTVLLEHPEFQQGLAIAQKYFLDEHEEAPLTEDEMVNEGEENLTYHPIEADRGTHYLHKSPYSYFYYLGYVFGIINEGLTYASSSR